MSERIAALRARIRDLPEAQRAAFRTKVEAAGIPWDRVVPPESEPESEPEADPVPRPDRLPLSPGQMQFWLSQALRPESAAFSIAFAWEVSGPLDPAALRRALAHLLERHAPLRSRFAEIDGTAFQQIATEVALPLQETSLAADPGAAERAFAARPFDLQAPPLFRVQLQSDGASRHRVLFAFHHIIADGWSRGVFLRELAQCYRAYAAGEPPDLPPLATPYETLLLRQSDWLNSPAAAAQAAYWRDQLAGIAPQELPSHGPTADRRAETRMVDLPAPLAAQVAPMAQRLGTTPFALLLAVFQLLLHRISGQADIAVGSPTAGRGAAGSEALIGLFVNTLVLRNRVAPGQRFDDWVAQVHQTLGAALAHQDLPFAKVVETLGGRRSADQTPLFQTLFQVQSGYGAQNAACLDLGDPRLSVRQHVIPLPEAKFDLSWQMAERDGGLSLLVEYRAALFSEAAIDQMVAMFETLLGAALRRPDTPVECLEFVPAQLARQAVLRGPQPAIPDLLASLWDPRGSDEIALICMATGARMTRAELLAAADRLARAIAGAPGTGRGRGAPRDLPAARAGAGGGAAGGAARGHRLCAARPRSSGCAPCRDPCRCRGDAVADDAGARRPPVRCSTRRRCLRRRRRALCPPRTRRVWPM